MWPTPTPLPPMPTPELLGSLDLEGFTQDFTGGLVQGFNFFDAQPIAAVVWFVILALLILWGITSIRDHLENL